MLYIGPDTKQRITKLSAGKYPTIAMGFIFGTEDSEGNRTITDMMTIEGTNSLIDPFSDEDLNNANAYAKLHDLLLLGVFQTVTDNPVSAESLKVSDAKPDFSYLLVSLEDGNLGSLRSFRTKSSGTVEEELISDKPIA